MQYSVTVAKEVLLAERGGQWLLSCFGPFRDRPVIPGMDDLSPEEVRCELYEAQKNGLVEQAVSVELHLHTITQLHNNLQELFLEITLSTIVPRYESEKRSIEKSHQRDNHNVGMTRHNFLYVITLISR